MSLNLLANGSNLAYMMTKSSSIAIGFDKYEKLNANGMFWMPNSLNWLPIHSSVGAKMLD
jgi:hypothetical protein